MVAMLVPPGGVRWCTRRLRDGNIAMVARGLGVDTSKVDGGLPDDAAHVISWRDKPITQGRNTGRVAPAVSSRRDLQTAWKADEVTDIVQASGDVEEQIRWEEGPRAGGCACLAMAKVPGALVQLPWFYATGVSAWPRMYVQPMYVTTS